MRQSEAYYKAWAWLHDDYLGSTNWQTCKYCGEEIFFGNPGTYWHYWDTNTRSFFCTSMKGVHHPYHPYIEPDPPVKVTRRDFFKLWRLWWK